MRYGNGTMRRFFASLRSNSLKKSKADLNFKETNNISNPFDIIDRNIPGIEHRLRLLEMRRLKEQLKLDRPDLENLKMDNLSTASKNNNAPHHYEITYSIVSAFPGLNYSSEESFDSRVNITSGLNSFGILNTPAKRIIKLINSDKKSTQLEFSVSDFPLVSQNKARAIEALRTIVDLTRAGKIDKINDSISFNRSFNCSSKKRNKESELAPVFPAEWLQAALKTE